MQLLRCPIGGPACHAILRSVLGAERPAHDSILDPREAQTARTADNKISLWRRSPRAWRRTSMVMAKVCRSQCNEPSSHSTETKIVAVIVARVLSLGNLRLQGVHVRGDFCLPHRQVSGPAASRNGSGPGFLQMLAARLTRSPFSPSRRAPRVFTVQVGRLPEAGSSQLSEYSGKRPDDRHRYLRRE
jgi:hypothetical protein